MIVVDGQSEIKWSDKTERIYAYVDGNLKEVFSCNHQFSNTHKIDNNVGSPIWKCIKCGKKVSST